MQSNLVDKLVGFHFYSPEVCALLTWGLCFLSPTEHTMPAPTRATMRDNEKDRAACLRAVKMRFNYDKSSITSHEGSGGGLFYWDRCCK
jgi:hypothetical protein